jgi:hypothetical protein
VVDLIASEYGADIVKQWHTKKGKRTKTVQIKMQLAGSLQRARVFGKNGLKKVAEKIKSSCQEMDDKEDKTLKRYIERLPPYQDWIKGQITKNQVGNPSETSD